VDDYIARMQLAANQIQMPEAVSVGRYSERTPPKFADSNTAKRGNNSRNCTTLAKAAEAANQPSCDLLEKFETVTNELQALRMQILQNNVTADDQTTQIHHGESLLRKRR
jgi:biotin synthase-related radical SAM superfamily protein